MGGSASSRSTYNQNPQGPAQYSYNANTQAPARRNLLRNFSRISDEYNSIDEVTSALRKAGLESSNLIIGIDFTKSNEWTGKKSFNGKSLHALVPGARNPYEQAISIIGRTLSPFDDDNLIPCFGFGDVTTHDRNVFSFYPNQEPCEGFEEVLRKYREILPNVKLAGPTSFAPIIEAAIDIVEQNYCQYHVLLIIADGQVTRSVELENNIHSPQEKSTIDAIVAASKYPLSIVLVGVGDGPWDMMKEFDDNIPERDFDNFQFVNFTEIMSKNRSPEQKEADFALAALMEIPSQFKAAIALNLLNRDPSGHFGQQPLPPPTEMRRESMKCRYPEVESFNRLSYHEQRSTPRATQSSENNGDVQMCPVCWVNPKDMAFNCGHQTCQSCGNDLNICPICRVEIRTRLRLF